VESLQRLVHRHGVQPRISFAGWVDGENKQRLLRNASLFASPSFQENFGISIVEALAAGVPVLVSRHVNLAEAVGAAGAGWIVDADEASLRAGLEEALAAGGERERRGQAGRELARRFAWPRIGAELLDLYQRLTANARSEVPRTVPHEAAEINVR
jgi:glycosyltransferase involved in cell wall biosynthesis